MDKDKFNKIIINKVGSEIYLQLWIFIKKILKITLILSIGILIGIYIGLYINFEDKFIILGCN